MSDPDNPVPIYFTSLELENVRCFGERQRLDLSDENGRPVQWVLILGDNGVGKTTLLQCLAWMRPVLSDEEGKSIEPALNIEKNETLNSLIRVDPNVVAKVNLKATLSVGQGFGDESTESSDRSMETEAEMRGEDGRLKESIMKASANAEHASAEIQDAPPCDLAIFAYGAARRPGTLKLERGERSDALASLFRDSTELYDAEDILLKLDHRTVKSKDERDVERLQRIKKILATILPDITCESDIEILWPDTFSFFPLGPSGVRFNTPYGEVPLSALSLGYQTTLTWIVDLALRLFEHYPESPDPLSEPGIVLIDNIELHLHPRWQQRVMENLSNCFRAIQFVATAHSPLIVQAAEHASLAVLREENGEVKIQRHLQSVNSWRADQILASDLFDVPTRSKSIQKLIRERDELLDKMNRDQSEEDRLRLLEDKLDRLPTAEDSEDRAAMELIRSVATRLRDAGAHRP